MFAIIGGRHEDVIGHYPTGGACHIEGAVGRGGAYLSDIESAVIDGDVALFRVGYMDGFAGFVLCIGIVTEVHAAVVIVIESAVFYFDRSDHPRGIAGIDTALHITEGAIGDGEGGNDAVGALFREGIGIVVVVEVAADVDTAVDTVKGAVVHGKGTFADDAIDIDTSVHGAEVAILDIDYAVFAAINILLGTIDLDAAHGTFYVLSLSEDIKVLQVDGEVRSDDAETAGAIGFAGILVGDGIHDHTIGIDGDVSTFFGGADGSVTEQVHVRMLFVGTGFEFDGQVGRRSLLVQSVFEIGRDDVSTGGEGYFLCLAEGQCANERSGEKEKFFHKSVCFRV